MDRLATTFALVTLIAAAAPSPAAESRPDSTHARGVADTVTVLKPIEVRSARGAAPSQASSAVHLDRAKVVRFSPPTVSDALVAVPGLNISRTGPWATQVSLRGMTGERVAVLVDGVRLETGRGHGAQTSLVPIDRLESVDVEPGAGSAVNGSDAMAGTIEFSTHRPLLADRRHAAFVIAVRDGEPGYARSQSAQLRWLSPRVGFELCGSTSRLGRLVVPDSTYDNSGFRDQDVTGRAVARLGVATLDYEHSAHRAYDIGLPAFSDTMGGSARFPQQSRDLDRFELATRPVPGWPTARLLAVQQRIPNEYVERTGVPVYTRRRRVSTLWTTSTTRNEFLSRSAQPELELGHGRIFGELRREWSKGPTAIHKETWPISGAPPTVSDESGEAINPARRTVRAAGGGAWIEAAGMRLQADARWDEVRSITRRTAVSIYPDTSILDRRLTSEVSLSGRIGPWTPYAHAGSNFRAPNLDERFAHTVVHGQLFVWGNSGLRPEVARTAEVGLRSPELFGGAVSALRVSAYHNDVTDLIAIKYLDMQYGRAIFQYTNVHHVKIEGLEVQGELRAADAHLALGASLPRGWDAQTRERLSEVGAACANLDLRLPLPRLVPQGTFFTRARWTDAHRAARGEELMARPAYWTLSSELGCTALGVRWAAVLTNITNTRYSEPLSFVPMAGRSLTLSARRSVSLL